MAQIQTGFKAARQLELDRDKADKDDLWRRSRYLQWAGYELYQVSAPQGKPHLTRMQLRTDLDAYGYEYIFPGGLSPAECDDLWFSVVGVEGADESYRELEWLVTGTLAGMLHAGGMSLEEYIVCFACGRSCLIRGLSLEPANAPTTLSAAVRSRGWPDVTEWLRDTQATLEQGLDEIRQGRAVWVPESAPRLPWEPLILRYFEGQGCMRLALGSEAAAYAGSSVELAVSAAARGDWLPEREAARMAGMSNYQFRRWIETRRRWVRIGRPIASDGQPARNRRLIHRGDLRRALRLACRGDKGEEICNPQKCWMSCQKARECPRRARPTS